MELKYVRGDEDGRLTCRSNRTFMELKLLKIGKYSVIRFRSNRTFMELKYIHYIEVTENLVF